MNIAVVTSSPLFAKGGHLVIADALVRALGEAGHAAEVVLTPQNRFGRQGAAYLATWLTDVGMTHEGATVDQVISLRYPSYAVRHERHVCWLNHRMREYYDLWPRFAGSIGPRARLKERMRRALIHAADRYLLTRNVRRLFAQSQTVQRRLVRWGGIRSEVLYPPAPQRRYRCDGYGDFVFAVSRLEPLKRLDLLVDAMAEPACRGLRCVIAGEGRAASQLAERARAAGVDGRVTFVGAVTPDELVRHLAACRAVCFPAYDEDYGLVSVEAFASAKAVVTCADSGGPAELVEASGGGLVAEATPQALAVAIARVFEDRTLAIRLGEAGHRFQAHLTWPAVVDRLLAV